MYMPWSLEPCLLRPYEGFFGEAAGAVMLVVTAGRVPAGC